MKYTPNPIAHRLRLIYIGVIVLVSIIGLALAYFQIYHRKTFDSCSKQNAVRIEEINSIRGTILDRFGTALATNRPVSRLQWLGSGNKRFTDEQHETLARLEAILQICLLDSPELAHAERMRDAFTLVESLSPDQLESIVEQFSENENLSVETVSCRYYPYGTAACHIVGYFRDTTRNRLGSLGLERLFEEQLRGHPGYRENLVNALGQRLITREIEMAQAGRPLRTTIDFNIQLAAERVFEQSGEDGAMIVMDPRNGDILALVSRPAFDPNMFVGSISHATWEWCAQKQPFVNRALTNYPPASLFKLVTMAAAMEEQIIDEHHTWNCQGEISYGGREFHCMHKHGILNPENALAASCNVACYEIGKRIAIDTLAQYANALGLGKPTGIALPEKRGLIPTTTWKKKHLREKWVQGETLLAAIGQSYLLVTPLQMARLTGGICTGYLVRPRILLDEPIEKTPVQISEKTRTFLMRSMKSMITHGTGAILAQLNEFDIYGKTGTAQTASLDKQGMGKKYVEHGWFIGYAPYKNHRPIVVAIISEHVGTSAIAVHRIKQFFSEYRKYCDQGEALDPECLTTATVKPAEAQSVGRAPVALDLVPTTLVAA